MNYSQLGSHGPQVWLSSSARYLRMPPLENVIRRPSSFTWTASGRAREWGFSVVSQPAQQGVNDAERDATE
jgi:hypothetical protein